MSVIDTSFVSTTQQPLPPRPPTPCNRYLHWHHATTGISTANAQQPVPTPTSPCNRYLHLHHSATGTSNAVTLQPVPPLTSLCNRYLHWHHSATGTSTDITLQPVPPLTSPYHWCLCRQTNHTKASISTATTPNKAIKTFLYLRKQKSDAIFRRN